jgi:hypothetical protein
MNLLADILSLKYLFNSKELILIPELYINIFFFFFFYLFYFFFILIKLVYYEKKCVKIFII